MPRSTIEKEAQEKIDIIYRKWGQLDTLVELVLRARNDNAVMVWHKRFPEKIKYISDFEGRQDVRLKKDKATQALIRTFLNEIIAEFFS